MKKKLYAIKTRLDGRFELCPLCNKRLDYCHLGEICMNKNCGYCDGVARLTTKQAIKYKNKVLREMKLK